MNDTLIEEDGAERAAAKIAELLPALREAGVDKIIIDYDGGYDEGTCRISANSNLPDSLSEVIEDHARAIVPSEWTEDEGGFGEIVIDAVRGSLTVDHYSRYNDEEDETWTARIAPDPTADPDSVTVGQGEAVAAIGNLLGPLREAGIANVWIHYDGSGDSGAIERIEPQTIPEALQQALEEHAYDLLPGGWEINEGSHGVITIDVNEGCLVVEHSWRVIETESSKHGYQLF
jgi:hypothetical protein